MPKDVKPARKVIDIKEFRKLGYLQELNRQFLHPLGLALEVVVEDDGTERLGEIWDSRGDPEGFIYGDHPDFEKARSIQKITHRAYELRTKLIGYWVQPL